MAKLATVEAFRRARAAGLSVVDSTALARLHESEDDLTELIKLSADEDSGGDGAGTPPATDSGGVPRGSNGNRLPAKGDKPAAGTVAKIADDILGAR